MLENLIRWLFRDHIDKLIGNAIEKEKAIRINELVGDVVEAERAAACAMAHRFEIHYRERGETEKEEAMHYLFNALHARVGTYDYGLALLKHWRELGADL